MRYYEAEHTHGYARIKAEGLDQWSDLLSSALYDTSRDYGEDCFDPVTGIVWTPTSGAQDDAEMIGGSWYLPHRRHLTAAALHRELERHGLRVVEQSAAGGDIVAVVCPRG